jgi:hypothetical protein
LGAAAQAAEQEQRNVRQGAFQFLCCIKSCGQIACHLQNDQIRAYFRGLGKHICAIFHSAVNFNSVSD